MPLSGPGVLAGYLDDIRERGYDDDADQRRIAAALDDLRTRLATTQATVGHWPFSRRRRRQTPVRGLYIYGDVGRGKTYLMDLFHERLAERRKLRKHFHSFMKNVHDALAALPDQADPLHTVAREIAANYRVICFDEFFVSDIADAMLLGNLFTALFENGVTLVATSNVAPDDLYKDGLQRARFLPAIEALKAHCNVLRTDGPSDYRLRVLRNSDAYRTPLGEATTQALCEDYERLVPVSSMGPGHIPVNGRPIAFVRRGPSVGWFSFDAVCRGPRSTLDYIELAKFFSTLILSDVPQLTATTEDEARRFIALIDELYDRRVNLMLSAEVPLDQLYAGEKLAFEFKRTASRLQEMQGEEYLAQAHRC